MWSMFSQDFTDFAKAFKSESAGFVDYLGNMASDVVGRGDVYAGDEVLKKTTQRMPLPNALLRRLQEQESTYCLPIQPEEREAFAAWMQANPLSSHNARRRLAEAAAAEEGEEGEKATAAESPKPPSANMTPSRGSAEWSDEPVDETRQRLLDYNETVLQWYMALVGEAVSPRASFPGSPATPEQRRRLMDPPSTVKFDQEDDVNNVTPARVPSAAKTPSAARRVSEDDFFDRYFFRLTQLRVSEAQRRRDGAVRDSADVSPLPASATRGGRGDASATSSMQSSPQSHSPQPRDNDTSRQSADDDDFVAVPLFAKRMMTAASGFVTNIDNALNNVVTAETSRCSGEGVDTTGNRFGEDESANVDPSELGHFIGAKRQVAELEALVQELQETLRHERRRVQQLTATLEAHAIEVPAELPSSAAPTPAKSTAAGTPERHADPTAAMVSSSPAAAAVNAAAPPKAAEPSQVAVAGASPAEPARASTVSPPSAGPAVEGRKSPAAGEKVSSVISAGSEFEEEEEDAWVNVNPSAEQSV